MSTQLFRRAWKVTVDTLDVSGLHIEFKILRTLKREPNKCAVVIWNLSEDHRAQLLKRNRPNQDTKKIQGINVRVEAGYIDNVVTLFDGDLREVGSVRDGANWKTTITGDDGGRSYREARITASFKKDTTIDSVLQKCVDAMGIGTGNLDQFKGVKIGGIGSRLTHALTVDGSAAEQLDRIIKSCGLTWSIQAGALQILERGKPLEQKAFRITPSNGLVGSPEASIDSSVSLGNPQQFAAGAKAAQKKVKPKDPDLIKIKTLLIPGVLPGRKIVLESASFNGNYMLMECDYFGSSWSNDWNIASVARQYH